MPSSAWKKKSEEHTSELQSPCNLVCRLLLEKNNHYAIVSGGVCLVWSNGDPARIPQCQASRLSKADSQARLQVATTAVEILFFFKERPPPGTSPFPPTQVFQL